MRESIPQFPGIVRFAASVGRSREHIYRVLVGQRQSTVIHRQWKEFKRGAMVPRLSPQKYSKVVKGLTGQQRELLAEIQSGQRIVSLHALDQGLTDALCEIIRAFTTSKR